MKIGIITYHRAHNYGAVLQCYALQELLKKQGHEVEIVDYRQPSIEKLYRPSKIQQIYRNKFHPRALFALRNKFIQQKENNYIYDSFSNLFLKLSQKCNASSLPIYDVYIIGSDQMWSIDCVGDKIDPVYFGMFNRPEGSKLIGFSISSNLHTINVLGKNICNYIDNFDNISYRESFIANEIEKFSFRKFEVTLDPTLCVDEDIWNNMINYNWQKKKYIVLYHVKFRFSSIVHKLLLKQVQRISKLNNWEIVDLSSGNFLVSDFISIIKFAQCVVTTSFHATVFSLIFGRPFFSVKLHDGQDSRYVNLLESLDMESSLVDLDFNEEKPITYDYSYIKRKLNELRGPSLDFLHKNI